MNEIYKRFIAQNSVMYESSGGFPGPDESFDTLEEAIAYSSKIYADFTEVFDCDQRRIVWEK